MVHFLVDRVYSNQRILHVNLTKAIAVADNGDDGSAGDAVTASGCAETDPGCKTITCIEAEYQSGDYARIRGLKDIKLVPLDFSSDAWFDGVNLCGCGTWPQRESAAAMMELKTVVSGRNP